MIVNDPEYIEKLINAFYEGDTSPLEEKILYKFFSKGDVPQHLESDRVIFMRFASLQNKKIASSLDKKLELLIDKLSAEEKISRKAENKIKTNLKIDWKRVTAVAASLLILLSIGIYTFHSGVDTDNIIVADTFENPEEAYIETQKTLLYVSNKLNKGFEQVETAKKNLEKSSKIVEKNIQL